MQDGLSATREPRYRRAPAVNLNVADRGALLHYLQQSMRLANDAYLAQMALISEFITGRQQVFDTTDDSS